jgi:peptide/nickel transport system substrate-binding protein
MRSFVAALALLALLAAAPAPGAAAARPLRLGLVQQPNSLDPLHAVQFFENYLAEAMFSGLCVIDDRGEVAPDLAREVPTRANGGISADGKTIVYHLRPGVRWQDGVALTSRDVAFTFALMRDPKTNFPETSIYAIVDRLETPDPQTVVLRLRQPWADATSELFVDGQDGAIVPEHVLRGVTDLSKSAFESQPVGSGPYALGSWERGSKIVLRANPLYFRGAPHIARIDIEFVPDQNVLALRVKDGELDFSPQVPVPFAAQLRDTPQLRVRAVPAYTDVELVFETRNPPFDDARVRRALSLAVDRARLTQDVYHGFAVPDDDLVPPQSPFHVAGRFFAPAGNLEGARRLLDGAGWKLGADGLRHKDGRTLSFALTTQAGYAAIAGDAVQLQAMWHEIGAEAGMRPMLSNLLLAQDGTLAKGDFQVLVAGNGYAVSPDRADTLTTGGLPPGRNYSLYSDRDVDAWTAQARVTENVAVRRALYAKVSERVRRDAPLCPLLWIELVYVYNGALHGLRPETVNSDFWNVYDWTLDQ